MNTAAKINRGLFLEASIKEQKKELDQIKSDLQGLALADMENKNIKYMELFSDQGRCEVAYKEKFEIDNYPRLLRTIGSLARDKIKRRVEVKFDVNDDKFKKALTVLVKKQYARHDITQIVVDLGLSGKAASVALKKLKGDYKKDKAILESLGITGDLEEELDAIREQKNLELIERYFSLSELDLEALEKAVWIEESLSIALIANDKESVTDAG